MAKWIAAVKVRAGLRQSCSSMPERNGKDQGEGGYVCFLSVLLHFCIFAFIEAVTLRSIILRYACSPTATRTYQVPNS